MKLKELYQLAKSQGKTDICRFMRDMRRAGLKMRYYEGRMFWRGPSVDVADISDAMSLTKVKCQFDSMGLGYVVYPRQGMRSFTKEAKP